MSSFHERQKNLFKHLKDAEEQYSFSKSNKATSTQLNVPLDKQTYRKVKKEMKPFRGRESIFKRSEANLWECLRARTVPDFIKNPKKWVYYSLSDVTPDQMSDSTNTATALAFIREMEDRESSKIKRSEVPHETDVFKKPTFQPSVTLKNNIDVREVKTIKSNKIIMPEYVVGVTPKKEKKAKIHKKTSKETCEASKTHSTVQLNHLYEDD